MNVKVERLRKVRSMFRWWHARGNNVGAWDATWCVPLDSSAPVMCRKANPFTPWGLRGF